MSEPEFSIRFETYSTRVEQRAQAVIGNHDAIATLEHEARKAGLAAETGTRSEMRELPDTLLDHSSGERRRVLQYPATSIRRHRNHYIPPDGMVELWSWVVLSGTASAGVAVFLRNVLGIIKDGRDLLKNVTVQATIDGKEVEVKDGDDLRELLKRYEARLKRSKPGGARLGRQ